MAALVEDLILWRLYFEYNNQIDWTCVPGIRYMSSVPSSHFMANHEEFDAKPTSIPLLRPECA
jgi:hypothetical protein